ncbi:hypothetical protein FSP39_023975 [Pinctada imbricata]|uniref:NACHT domain-containing protein n=1 Tax=Pinctada imbricata TaxID=66713 RepID=A0AA89C5W2_PINIB|nr:hypothetical protein FSP39_023975 [Pinctada imbricata]
MSRDDEVRYGRACLLVLNVCPFTLRQVIDDYSLRHAGSLSLFDFLEKNKHSLFHLYAKKCCCKHLQQNRSTPMYKSQWDSLFMQNTSSCQKGKNIDCPCKYDCKPGITTKVMDVTLCCLVINNICPGVDVNHIKTIREIRNNLIHAESARLDLLTFNGYMNRVKTAVCELAKNVSITLHTETLEKIVELENRLMDPVELSELRNLIIDQRRFTDLEDDVSNIADDLNQTRQEMAQISTSVSETTEKVTQISASVSETTEKVTQISASVNETSEKVTQISASVSETTEKVSQISTSVSETTEKVTQIEEQTRRELSQIRGTVARQGQEIKEELQHVQEQLRPIQQESNEHRRQVDDYDRRIDDHGRQIDDYGRQIDDHGRLIDDYGRQIDDHGRQIDEQAKQIADIKQSIPYGKVPPRQDEDPGVKKMKERLMEINDKLTRFIQLSPLQDTEEKLPIELLYASVVICEDEKYVTKGNEHGESSRYMEELTRHRERRRAGTSDLSYVDTFRRLSRRLAHRPGLSAARLGTHAGTSDFEIGSYKYEMSNLREVTDPDGRDFELFSSVNERPKIREVTNPDDIFQKDSKYVSRIYMLGDAAHGKTTYCVWLLRKWCNAKRKERTGQKNFDKWEKELTKFDFVFLMKFRNVNDPNLVSVVDMICQDAFESDKGCHGAIHHVLSSDEYKSLIILDGLDELNLNSKNRMPKIDVSGSVTCFITMRPWVFPLLSKKPQHSDRVIEIRGLSETGMENIIKNVLVNHYKLKENSPKYTQTNDKIVKSLKDKSLKSFMQIPLLAVVCVQIWYDGNQVGDSITSFYAEMINMLIERAIEKQKIELEHYKTEKVELPQILSVYGNIENCSSVLLKLGKVAYAGLLSNETNLVFQKSKLEKEIGVKELQFALDVGLISQKEARSLTTKNVSVHFFHKSIQEFLAVIYIVTNKEVGDSFCKHLSSVKVILELSNVIMFICGMCPSLGSVISQRVVSMTDSETKICKYRESPGGNSYTVEELYKLQTSWYRELEDRQTDSPVTFHVSDVYLSKYYSDIETVRGTRDVLSDPHVVDIRSLYLHCVPTDIERGVTNIELNNFLNNKHLTCSLDMVYINGDYTDRSVSPICIPSLKTLYLCDVKINTDLDDDVCPPLLTDMTSLRKLVLYKVTLGDRGLGLSADMVHIEKVRLWSVNMSSLQWQQFILSVLNIQHRFNVELRYTNIDDESMTKIRSSPDFNVTRDGVDKYGGYEFYFTRVWPPQVTQ